MIGLLQVIFGQFYHWSIMQAEHAADIVFKKQSDLQAVYLYLMAAIVRGEFNIMELKLKNLKNIFPEMNLNQVSRLLKRLCLHELVKRVAKSCKYYLTKPGKMVIATALKLKENILAPSLSLSYA